MSFVHYEVRHRGVGDKVMVEAVLFSYTEMTYPTPPVSPLTGYPYNPLGAQFIQTIGIGPGPWWVRYVGPPNWWERQRGKTWSDKIDAAHDKVERWAIRKVRKSIRALQQVGIVPVTKPTLRAL